MSYTKEQVLTILKNVSQETGMDYCVLVAAATIESNLNPNARNSAGYTGLFQLANGYGGVSGQDLYDPYKNAIGAVKKMKSNKSDWQSSGRTWSDVYYYITHQQGFCGAALIYDSQDMTFTEASNPSLKGPGGCRGITIHKNMKNNPPQTPVGGPKPKIDYDSGWVRDWLNAWINRWNSLVSQCNNTPFTPVDIASGSSTNSGTSDQGSFTSKAQQEQISRSDLEKQFLEQMKKVSSGVLTNQQVADASFKPSGKSETEGLEGQGKNWEYKRIG